MEKLSSILPSNSRIKSVDTEESHPARPGSSTMGRPEGSTASLRDKITISARAAALKDAGLPKEATAPAEVSPKYSTRETLKEEQGVNIAAQVSRSFNDVQPREIAKESSLHTIGPVFILASAPEAPSGQSLDKYA